MDLFHGFSESSNASSLEAAKILSKEDIDQSLKCIVVEAFSQGCLTTKDLLEMAEVAEKRLNAEAYKKSCMAVFAALEEVFKELKDKKHLEELENKLESGLTLNEMKLLASELSRKDCIKVTGKARKLIAEFNVSKIGSRGKGEVLYALENKGVLTSKNGDVKLEDGAVVEVKSRKIWIQSRKWLCRLQQQL